MTQRNLVLGAILSTLLMSACSAKVSGGDAPSVPPVAPFGNKITGPVVEGSWSSQCVMWFNSYHQRKMTFTGQQIFRVDNDYSDKDCTQLTNKDEVRGVFRWVDKTSYGGYSMDYRLDIGQGVTQITGEELLIENNLMYLSGFQVGFGSIDKALPMSKDGAAPAPGKPSADPTPEQADPAKISGVIATSLATAKYAFCNAQGFGYILDFQNQDLSSIKEGTVKLSGRVCNRSGQFQDLGSAHFTIERPSEKVGDFKISLDDGYINGNARNMKDADALMSGNSGMCTFLTNNGIQGVFPADYGNWQCE